MSIGNKENEEDYADAAHQCGNWLPIHIGGELYGAVESLLMGKISLLGSVDKKYVHEKHRM
jgi:hypothetical protein